MERSRTQSLASGNFGWWPDTTWGIVSRTAPFSTTTWNIYLLIVSLAALRTWSDASSMAASAPRCRISRAPTSATPSSSGIESRTLSANRSTFRWSPSATAPSRATLLMVPYATSRSFAIAPVHCTVSSDSLATSAPDTSNKRCMAPNIRSTFRTARPCLLLVLETCIYISTIEAAPASSLLSSKSDSCLRLS